MAHAPAGRPLDLVLNAVDVTAETADAAEYRFEVVAASGKQIWDSAPHVSSGALLVHLPQGLPEGLYWARVYSQQSKVLGEFGLVLE